MIPVFSLGRPEIARLGLFGRFLGGSTSASGGTDGTSAAGFLFLVYTSRAALVFGNGVALVAFGGAEPWVGAELPEVEELLRVGTPKELTATRFETPTVVGVGPILPLRPAVIG